MADESDNDETITDAAPETGSKGENSRKHGSKVLPLDEESKKKLSKRRTSSDVSEKSSKNERTSEKKVVHHYIHHMSEKTDKNTSRATEKTSPKEEGKKIEEKTSETRTDSPKCEETSKEEKFDSAPEDKKKESAVSIAPDLRSIHSMLDDNVSIDDCMLEIEQLELLKGEPVSEPARMMPVDPELKNYIYAKKNRVLGEAYNRMRLQKELVDTVFIIGNRKFLAHRAILSAEMFFFKKLFRKEKGKIVTIKEEDFAANIFEIILEFAYSGRLKVNRQNYRALFEAAILIEQEDIKLTIEKNLCEDIDREVKREIFFELADFAEENKLEKLHNNLVQFVSRNFEEFTSINKNQTFVKSLLGVTNREELRFRAAIKWAEYDCEETLTRLKYLHIVLQAIPMTKLSTAFLNSEVVSSNLIAKSPRCLKVFFEACGKTYTKATVTRKPLIFSTKYVFAIGGLDKSQLNSASKWNPAKDQWEDVATMMQRRSHFNAAVIGKRIYVAGGTNGNEALNSVEVYDPTKNQWELVKKPMKYARLGCGVAALNNQLYVCGGKNKKGRLAKFERYDPITDEWVELTPMRKKRCGVELLAFSGFLYAIGGCSCDSNRTVERYDPTTDIWTQIASMRNNRNCQGSAVLNDRIYTCGKKLEVYVPEFNTWKVLASRPTPTGRYRLMEFDGRLLLIGGVESLKPTSTVREFDFNSHEWRVIGRMNSARSFHATATIEF